MAKWKISADEIKAGAGSESIVVQTNGKVTPKHMVKASSTTSYDSTAIKTGIDPSGSSASNLDREEIKAMIDESLDRKLAPIINMLAESYDRGPRLTDVIGGIGYICGLVGVALYFANRRRKKELKQSD